MMVGTAFKAARKAVSDMAARALMPARINSLFLTELLNWVARCLRSSSTVYSALGMVKLSRTILGFLALGAFSAAGALSSAFATVTVPNARVLIHQPYAQSGYAQVSDLEIAANEIIRLKETLEQVLARHTGQPVEKIAKDTDRDYVMTAAEAKEYGIIDEVFGYRKKSLNK